jgi:hypothetical protein
MFSSVIYYVEFGDEICEVIEMTEKTVIIAPLATTDYIELSMKDFKSCERIDPCRAEEWWSEMYK